MKNETWTLVPRPKHAKVVKSRWVLRIKDCRVYKARFCAKGYTQRWGEDYDETFAPVAKYTSIRTLISLLAGRKNAKLYQMDVNTAFLLKKKSTSNNLKDLLCQERRIMFVCSERLYGLRQSPREWFMTIASALVNFKFQQCTADPCIFVHTNDNVEKTYIALYVDDLLIAGDNDEDIATIKQLLSERFDMKDLGIAKKFLDMEIEYGSDGSIKIHQNHYLQQLLLRHDMAECNSVHTPLDTTVKLIAATDDEALADSTEYASIVGGLMFAACVTRPDIMCAAGQLSQFLAKPSFKHMHAAKCVLRYLQGTLTYGIIYRPPPMGLTGYSDADWADDINTRRSTTGYVVMLNNGAVAWKVTDNLQLRYLRWKQIWLLPMLPKNSNGCAPFSLNLDIAMVLRNRTPLLTHLRICFRTTRVPSNLPEMAHPTLEPNTLIFAIISFEKLFKTKSSGYNSYRRNDCGQSYEGPLS